MGFLQFREYLQATPTANATEEITPKAMNPEIPPREIPVERLLAFFHLPLPLPLKFLLPRFNARASPIIAYVLFSLGVIKLYITEVSVAVETEIENKVDISKNV